MYAWEIFLTLGQNCNCKVEIEETKIPPTSNVYYYFLSQFTVSL